MLLTAGTSEGIELALKRARRNPDGEVLVPRPTYPLYTAVLAKLGARAVFCRTDPARGWIPDLDHLATLVTPSTRALVVIDPNNPTGATYSTAVRRSLVNFSERHGLVMLADEVYGDLGYDGALRADRHARSRRRDHFVLEPLQRLHGTRLAHRLARGRAHAAVSNEVLAAVRKVGTGGCAARCR